jgi:hypothetical protein
MGRAIVSVVAGYVAIIIAVFGLMTVAWFALGVNGAFVLGTWEVSGTWIVVMLVVSLLAAVVGGYVAAMISPDWKGPKLLIGLVLVLGILMAIPALTGSGPAVPETRSEDVAMFDAMQTAKQPSWLALVNPLLGAAGVWLGARLRVR